MQAVTARHWLRRWDAQQELYIPDREERFRVVIDVVRWATREGPAKVIDLGCGPGSLSVRLADALPGAEVVGVDVDPLLLRLGNAQRDTRVRLVDADLSTPDWPHRTGLTPPWGAAVSSTALHWLPATALAELYRTLAAQLRPGAVFVNADHLHPDTSSLGELTLSVRQARTERAGTAGNEDWAAWWDALRADPELRQLVDDRSSTTIAHSSENGLSADAHARLLREAGFAEAGPVWQFGDDHVLVAVR